MKMSSWFSLHRVGGYSGKKKGRLECMLIIILAAPFIFNLFSCKKEYKEILYIYIYKRITYCVISSAARQVNKDATRPLKTRFTSSSSIFFLYTYIVFIALCVCVCVYVVVNNAGCIQLLLNIFLEIFFNSKSPKSTTFRYKKSLDI